MTTPSNSRGAAGVTGADRTQAEGAAARSGNGRTDGMAKAAAKEATWSPLMAPFAGLAEVPMQWLTQAAQMMTPKAAETPAPAEDRAGADWMLSAIDYWVDSAQRQVLFWDVMR